MTNDQLTVDDAPAIPGLAFRRFRGPSDYPLMVAAIQASADADKVERADTIEDIANAYAHLSNSDPTQDMIFAEVNGEVIGYSRAWWWEETNGPRIYSFVGFLVPAWRRKGIGRAMLHWLEQRLRQIAAGHPADRPMFFQGFAEEHEVGLAALLASEGYEPVRYFYQMVRPTLDDIPDFPLPAGIEVRPVLPEHYRAIWEADIEAFQDHWGFAPPTEEDYQAWLNNKTFFQPNLWQVGWDVATDQVAGQVRTFIDAAQNEKYQRQRGWTEFISVRRPWRRRGLARALIVRSLRVQKEQGMTESALGADSENLTGATRVYEDCGFRVTQRNTAFRKPL
ncbi:MAG TPA: GNAT family N-acetyltransferase [Anaerolineae bacterium]|nr:GNAT family N-acetyltransferase [Anaerolineae bacterium]